MEENPSKIKKLWTKANQRGVIPVFVFGFGVLTGDTLMWFIIGGAIILVSFGIFIYNWRHLTDNEIPSRLDSIRNSQLVWGFWHTGELTRTYFHYKTVKQILLIEPNKDTASFQHVKKEGNIKTDNELIANINLTKDMAKNDDVKVHWHNEVTAVSFSIYDQSPKIEMSGEIEVVSFSKKSYVIVWVLDPNLERDEWKIYKIPNKNQHGFNNYVRWFKDVWDNKSKPVD